MADVWEKNFRNDYTFKEVPETSFLSGRFTQEKPSFFKKEPEKNLAAVEQESEEKWLLEEISGEIEESNGEIEHWTTWLVNYPEGGCLMAEKKIFF